MGLSEFLVHFGQLGLGLGPVNTILTNSGMISADAMANAYATVSAIAEAEATELAALDSDAAASESSEGSAAE